MITAANPRSLLDIGAGFGKYGVLAREYLELHDYSWRKPNWQCHIDGIEAFEEYLSELHNFTYNHVFVGNALDIVPTLEEHYDLVLLVDVLEHFTFDDGVKLLKDCSSLANNVLVSTPLDWIAQTDILGNPYEIHKSLWKKRNFNQFGPHFFVPDPLSLICFMGKDSDRLKREVGNLRRKIKTWFPFVAYGYRWTKRALKLRTNGRSDS